MEPEVCEAPARPEEYSNKAKLSAMQTEQEQKAWAPTDKDIETIAHVCHEANRAICMANGDLSQPPWENAPEWQKESAIVGVKFHLSYPYANARDSHDKWMETKLRNGWKYGPEKNVTLKEHPCLLPHSALPQHEQVKDDVFKAIARGYIEGLQRSNR